LGYADDIAILIHRKFLNTVSQLLQEALTTVQQWCDRTQMFLNPQKMVIVPFTWKRDIRGLKEPNLCDHTLQPTTEVKCLGLILAKGFMWKARLKNVMNKAYRELWPCKGTFGKTWGLKPRWHIGSTPWYHGDQTCINLWLHGLVAKGQLQFQQDRAH
jgi:hypothetical protein